MTPDSPQVLQGEVENGNHLDEIKKDYNGRIQALAKTFLNHENRIFELEEKLEKQEKEMSVFKEVGIKAVG